MGDVVKAFLAAFGCISVCIIIFVCLVCAVITILTGHFWSSLALSSAIGICLVLLIAVIEHDAWRFYG